MDYNTLSTLCLDLGGESPNVRVSDEHLATIASKLIEWEPLAPHLGIDQAEEVTIRRNHPSSYMNQKYNVLHKWTQMCGKQATYVQLSRILLDMPTAPSVLVSFKNHLKACYHNARSPTVLQWPVLKHSYVDPIMYEVPVEDESEFIPGGMPTTARFEKPVELEAIFSAEQDGEVVLIEGVAGAGKTMLTWHTSQRWAEESLFGDTQLLIHISLRDRYIHSASCLTDLIPHPSKRLRKEVASTIVENGGRGVCYVLDGWDELPPQIQNESFLLDFVTRQGPHATLPKCKILVTSRPRASASLTPYVAKKIELQGFKEEQLRKYLSDSTEGSEKATDKLMKAVRINPQLMLLCLIPLMAAILVFLFSFAESDEALSLKTHTEMFKLLVITLLHRRMKKKHYRQKNLKEISKLPADLQEKFTVVCKVAFYGVVNDKTVFEFEDLQSLGMSPDHEIDTLGLMQANEQLTWFGSTKDYSFLHHHIQTFLAGYHISQLDQKDHAGAVREILQRHPLSSAVTVYAGLTKMTIKEAQDVLLEVSKIPLDAASAMASLAHSRNVGLDRRRQLVALLRCIYEAQSPQLCLLVKPPPHPGFDFHDRVWFSFDGLSLTPADCHAVAYCAAIILPTKRGMCLNFLFCFIKDEGVKAIMSTFQENLATNTTSTLFLNLSTNHISHRGMYSISRTLATTSVITHLLLGDNWHPRFTDIRLALKYLIQGLSHSSCKTLGIAGNHLTDEHVYHLVLLVTFCSSLRHIVLAKNKLGNCLFLIALAMNKSLVTRLDIDNCALTNFKLIRFGKALQANTTLLDLDLSSNPFTPAGFADFVRCLIPQPPALGPPLRKITVECQITHEHRQLVEKINQMRSISASILLHYGTIVRPYVLQLSAGILDDIMAIKFGSKSSMHAAKQHLTAAEQVAVASSINFLDTLLESPEFVSGESSKEQLYTS